MKLRNKKTGEIIEPFGISYVNGRTSVQFDDEEGNFKLEARSLAELNEEWEDYEEEPKRTWFIDTRCVPNYIDYGDNPITDHCYDDLNELGFCFETKEEAEKAVEKLKAWKRLRDNGLKFSHYEIDPKRGVAIVEVRAKRGPVFADQAVQFVEDLDLIFGGEE